MVTSLGTTGHPIARLCLFTHGGSLHTQLASCSTSREAAPGFSWVPSERLRAGPALWAWRPMCSYCHVSHGATPLHQVPAHESRGLTVSLAGLLSPRQPFLSKARAPAVHLQVAFLASAGTSFALGRVGDPWPTRGCLWLRARYSLAAP